MVRLRRYKKIIGFADTIIVNSQLSIVHSEFPAPPVGADDHIRPLPGAIMHPGSGRLKSLPYIPPVITKHWKK